ncbi:MAG: SDR family oxidoreductase [Rubrivivax sp.]|nr:SDR family oxidoreductase [Rubrivivax sp.]
MPQPRRSTSAAAWCSSPAAPWGSASPARSRSRATATYGVTYRWGSADLDEVRARFASLGAPEPLIVEADVSNEEDTKRLLDAVAERHAQVDVLISNVAFAQRTTGFDDWTRRTLLRSIDYTAWPLALVHQGGARSVREVSACTSSDSRATDPTASS